MNVTKSVALLAVAAFGVLLGSICFGADFPSEKEALSLLRNGQFAALDRRYADIQAAYKKRQITDEDLRAAFRVFYSPDPTLAEAYAAWVSKWPNSYVAHLARGIYYRMVGSERRGGDFAHNTSEKQFKEMREAFDVATHELELSMTLDDKPILSYLHSITISMTYGQRKVSKELLEKSVLVDPRNFIVREKYMGSLQTRWGGSVDEMNTFLDESRAAGLSAAQLRTLETLAAQDEGWVAQRIDGNTDAAVQAYLKAAELAANNNGCGSCPLLMEAANLLQRKNRHAEAIPLYAKILEADAKAIRALTGRAFSELEMRNGTRAQEDFTRAAELGDAYAQGMLGKMYLVGTSIPQNRDLAIQWLQKAADQGYQEAKELLPLAADGTRQFFWEPKPPK